MPRSQSPMLSSCASRVLCYTFVSLTNLFLCVVWGRDVAAFLNRRSDSSSLTSTPHSCYCIFFHYAVWHTPVHMYIFEFFNKSLLPWTLGVGTKDPFPRELNDVRSYKTWDGVDAFLGMAGFVLYLAAHVTRVLAAVWGAPTQSAAAAVFVDCMWEVAGESRARVPRMPAPGSVTHLSGNRKPTLSTSGFHELFGLRKRGNR